MCLAVPVRVVATTPSGEAVVESGGRQWRVSLDLLEGVAADDYVIARHGQAIVRLSAQEARETLALLEEIAAAVAAPGR